MSHQKFAVPDCGHIDSIFWIKHDVILFCLNGGVNTGVLVCLTSDIKVFYNLILHCTEVKYHGNNVH
jgi:hypothetical protein